MADLNIRKLLAKLLTQTPPFKFGVDDNGNYGYIKEGADTVTPFNILPGIISVIWSTTSDPANYTYTATNGGWYLAMTMYGDGGGNITSTGELTYIKQGTGRQQWLALIHCEPNDTITITSNNYSGGAYRGTNAFLMKITRNFSIEEVLQESQVSDSTTSLSKTLDTNNVYLLVLAACGSSRSASYSCGNTNIRSCFSSDTMHCLFIRPTNSTSLTANVGSATAGGSTISCYKIT